jgi:sugar O-acyltransferase (sialic acid O-acetyltransferase NeuD family)
MLLADNAGISGFFLDDTPDPLYGLECDFPVLGTIIDFRPKANDVLALGLADPASKEKIVGLLKPRGAVFETIIHPYSMLGRHNIIGEGMIVLYGSMSVNLSIGNFVTLLGCCLGHDTKVGDYSTISAWCNVMGRASIGTRVFLGGNAVVAPGVDVEDDAYVGVGSVVVKRVKRGEKVFGNPAREIGI